MSDDDDLDGVRSYLTTGVEVELDAYIDKGEARIESLEALARELVEFLEGHSVDGFEEHPDEKLEGLITSNYYWRWKAEKEADRRALLAKAKELLP